MKKFGIIALDVLRPRPIALEKFLKCSHEIKCWRSESLRPPAGLYSIMPTPDTNRLLITSAVLTGLTPLIPIPIVDDVAYTQLMRQMTARLAASCEIELSELEIATLSDARGGSCLPGCLGTIIVYPLRKLFRKIFFFLEWKRAVDTVSRTYYHGYLLDVALREGYLKSRKSEELRAAVDRVLLRLDTRFIERAVKSVFRNSKNVLRGAGDLLASKFSSRRGKSEKVASDQEEQQIEGVVAQLQSAFATLPAEHFAKLEEELKRELSL